MPAKPISRYFNWGLTFRWTQGSNEIAVKRGYVIEGRTFISRGSPKYSGIVPADQLEDPDNDEHTWLAGIPINATMWAVPGALTKAADAWANGTRASRT